MEEGYVIPNEVRNPCDGRGARFPAGRRAWRTFEGFLPLVEMTFGNGA